MRSYSDLLGSFPLLVAVQKERPPLDISHSLGVERLSEEEKEVGGSMSSQTS